MKLIVAVIQDRDSAGLLRALTEAGFRSTKLASTGGFLRSGNTTVLIGVDEAKVEHVIGIIRRTCRSREEIMSPKSPAAATGQAAVPFPMEVVVGGATVFVVDVDQFEKC